MYYRTIEKIKEKYNLTTKELMLHYAAVGGEVSTDLIRKMGMDINLQSYITTKSKLKGSFKYRKTGNIRGYQLTAKGINEAIDKDYRYSDYLHGQRGLRRLTKNIMRRKRMIKKAKLYFFFDEAGIEYFYKDEFSRSPHFLDSRFLKHDTDDEESDINHQIISSRCFGFLELADDYNYLTYVFDDEKIKLEFNTEVRMKDEYHYRYDDDNVKALIVLKDEEMLKEVALDLFSLAGIIRNHEKYENLKAIEYIDYDELHLITFNDSGLKQMHLLKNNIYTDSKIRNILKCTNNKKEEEFYKYEFFNCDGFISAYPCFFLYSIDINKIIKINSYLYNRANVCCIVVCFREYINLIRQAFGELSERVKFISVEKLNLFEERINT